MSRMGWDCYRDRDIDRLPVDFVRRVDKLRAKRAALYGSIDDESSAEDAARAFAAVKRLDAEIAAEEAREGRAAAE